MRAMHASMLFLHIAAAVVRLGGMVFLLFALHPSMGVLEPPLRLRLAAAVLRRFFVMVTASVAVLLVTGGWMFAGHDAPPPGWTAMAAIGAVMMLVFAHIAFAPYRRMQRAAAAGQWAAAAQAAAQVRLLAKINLVLGAIAVAAVIGWH